MADTVRVLRRRILNPNAGHEVGRVNVTPMIDVIMCLIIFYLLVGRLATTNQARNLPESGAGASDAIPAEFIVDILPAMEGSDARPITVNGVAGDEDRLEETLRRFAAAAGATGNPATRPRVQIRAPRDLPYGRLAPVLDACRNAGLTSVRLAAERRP